MLFPVEFTGIFLFLKDSSGKFNYLSFKEGQQLDENKGILRRI